jgi:hypothetical protein
MNFGLNNIFIYILFNLTSVCTFERRNVVCVMARLRELGFKEWWFDPREA